MKRILFFLCTITALFFYSCSTKKAEQSCCKKAIPEWKTWSKTPPMGWNSYDAYHQYITEDQFKQCVDTLAVKMKPYGYEYAIIDFRWYIKDFNQETKDQSRDSHIDDYGRAIPSPERYPSSTNGQGFKAIADYVHSKGMKFGIHIMRGIPRTSLKANTPILGTDFFAKDCAEPYDSCNNWNDDMWGVNHNEAGQAYYNSIFTMYANWGVDYIKADDMMVPPYHKHEIEMMRKAIDQCGRPIVLSLSCGESQVSFAPHLIENANMFRISIDIWDKWTDVKRLIELAHYWSPYIANGTWPDADMIPIGILRKYWPENTNNKGRETLLTEDEKFTMLNIWAMMRSPIMWGGDPISSSKKDYAMMTNTEWLDVIKNSRNNRQIYQSYGRGQGYNIWFADIENSDEKYFALFNITDEEQEALFNFEFEYLRNEKYEIRDLWQHKNLGTFKKAFKKTLAPHASAIYKLTPLK